MKGTTILVCVKDEKDELPPSHQIRRFLVASEVIVEVENEHRLRAAAVAKLHAVQATTTEGLERMRARIEGDTAVALDFLTDPASVIPDADGVRVWGHSIRVRRCPDHDDGADDTSGPSPQTWEGSTIRFPGT